MTTDEPLLDLGALASLPVREIGLVLSAGVFVALVIAWALAQRNADYGLRVTLVMLVEFAGLRLYSASSFVWGPSVESDEVWGLLRMGVLMTLTIIAIQALALLAFAVRRRRSPS